MATITADEKHGWAPDGRNIPIAVDEVSRLLDPWRGDRPVTSVTFLAGGLMNRSYRVRVGDDDVVLRFYDRDLRACAKEVALLSAVARRVTVPAVLYVAPAHQPVPFVVLEFVDGISLRDLKRSGDLAGISQAAYAAGRELAMLASVQVSNTSILATEFDANPDLLHGANINARLIDHFLESRLLRDRLGDEHAPRVHDFAWRHDAALSATESTSRIAHGDFNAANILVRQRDGHWNVAAILDWEFAFEGSIAYDIGNFLRYERASNPKFEPWFSQGLVDAGVALPADWRTIARVADLSALCELLTRPAMPDTVATEVRDLVLATLDERDQMT